MKPLSLPPRLKLIADIIRQSHPGKIYDIGTDHAKLPVWLLLDGAISRAVASDISPGPLAAARATAGAHGLSGKMEFVLCPGLEGMEAVSNELFVIAGMGGETIAGILEGASHFSGLANRFILQPMSAHDKLREYLFRTGYEISGEYCACEGNKAYLIIDALSGGAPASASPADLRLGRADDKRGDFSPYYTKELVRLKKELNGARLSGNEALSRQLATIIKEAEKRL